MCCLSSYKQSLGDCWLSFVLEHCLLMHCLLSARAARQSSVLCLCHLEELFLPRCSILNLSLYFVRFLVAHSSSLCRSLCPTLKHVVTPVGCYLHVWWDCTLSPHQLWSCYTRLVPQGRFLHYPTCNWYLSRGQLTNHYPLSPVTQTDGLCSHLVHQFKPWLGLPNLDTTL